MKRRRRKAVKAPEPRAERPERERFIGFQVGRARNLPTLPRDRHAPGTQVGSSVAFPDESW